MTVSALFAAALILAVIFPPFVIVIMTGGEVAIGPASSDSWIGFNSLREKKFFYSTSINSFVTSNKKFRPLAKTIRLNTNQYSDSIWFFLQTNQKNYAKLQ
jgi:hypothetical protein